VCKYFLIDLFKRKHKSQNQYQFWQEGSHPGEMDKTKLLILRLSYIHDNPVKRSYVDFLGHWRYFSARVYMSMASLMAVVLLTLFFVKQSLKVGIPKLELGNEIQSKSANSHYVLFYFLVCMIKPH